MKKKRTQSVSLIAIVVIVTLLSSLGLLLMSVRTSLENRGQAVAPKQQAQEQQFLVHVTDINLSTLTVALTSTAPDSQRPVKVVGLTREQKELRTSNLNWDCPAPDSPGDQKFCTTSFQIDATGGEEGFKLIDIERNSIQFDIQNTARNTMVGTWVRNNWIGVFGPAPYYPPEFSQDMILAQGQTIIRRAGVAMPASSVIPQPSLSMLAGVPAGLGLSSVYCCEESTPFAFNVKYFDISFFNATFNGSATVQVQLVNHESPPSVLNEFPSALINVQSGINK